EVLRDYLGPKLHMTTSQDHVAKYYLKSTTETAIDPIFDASSIAIITLHLLHKLQCSPVILVGQNLAHRGRKNYADGANVFFSNQVSEVHRKGILHVESVDGGQVETTK